MHGLEGEEKKRHMWPVPVIGTTIVAAADSTIASVTSNFFCKDGRRISVGDCALFKPNQESSPPFIGRIRCLTSGKEDYLQLGVNWLYRPADVKLGKGILLEAAPNEVFYSFHKDEIPAASLLHPCKVAFLRKGVELPSGISSFVCRRVYDTANKRLWWLTDQDYINERQEEVDKLLDKTRIEMHAAVQSGGRSPKTLNVPTTAPQLKPGSDSNQNSSTSFSSQVKGKKRDRVDQASEPIKRERCSKTDDGDSGQLRLESTLKTEIAKITDKGGLADYEGVEKLVRLMHPDRSEKKIELSGRVILADVISATERHECLVRFVQRRGLSILDEWLQEVHKGKIGDVSSPKESDKPIEEFLLALLRALDKLPVNLHALQTCNVGKSVNLLRSHKNLEIQKKSRSLVDTWKKRVEAEMRINDTKSGSAQAASWANRQGIPEASQTSQASYTGNKRSGGSSEVPVNNSMPQAPASKAAPAKLVHGDNVAKTLSVSPGSANLAASLPASMVASKDPHCKNPGDSETTDLPLTTVREDKSSSSSQSQNNSQTCSSDHAKTVSGSSWKEDARSSTAGSMNANKSSNGARHRKITNGFPGSGSVVSGAQKETTLVNCSSMNRNNPSEKVPPSGLPCERAADLPLVDHTNSQRLVVRLPNPGRSPARSASGCSLEDPSGRVSRASSPVLIERHEHGDRKVKGNADGCQVVITETWQSNEAKESLVACGEANGSPGALLGEECSRSVAEVGKASDSSKGAPLSSGSDKVVSYSEPKQGRLNEVSLTSINALVDSCVKASASMSVGDDVGMNLLASVAAGEMAKSDLVSPIGSSQKSSPVLEVSITANVSKSRLSCEDGGARMQGQSVDGAGGDAGKQGTIVAPLLVKDGFQHVSANASDNLVGDVKTTTSSTSEKKKPKLEHSEKVPATSLSSQQTVDPCLKSDVKPDVIIPTLTMLSVDTNEEDYTGADSKTKLKNPSEDENKKVKNADGKVAGVITGTSGLVRSAISDVSVVGSAASPVKDEKKAVEETLSCSSSEMNVENKSLEGLTGGTRKEQKLPPVVDQKAVRGSAGDVLLSYGSGNSSCADNSVELKLEKADRLHASSNHEPSENHRVEQATVVHSTPDGRDAAGSRSVVVGHHTIGDNSDKEIVLKHQSSLSAPCEELPSNLEQETARCVKSSGAEADKLEESASTAEASSLSVAAGTGSCQKLDFDLNEGFPLEEGTQGDAVNSTAPPGCPAVIHVPSPLQFSLSSMSSSLPASITVAAAAKGPFVPPENILRNKEGIGWKGSAATSAFRRAEPRRVLEMSLGTSDISPDVSAIKQGRLPLDIDLNVADEVPEDMASQSFAQEICFNSGRINSGGDLRRIDLFGSSVPVRSAAGFDLDLNRVDEDTDMGQFPASTSRRLEISLLPVRQPSSGGFSNGEVSVLRDFDLNNGPGVDESSTEPASLRQHRKSDIPFLPPISGLRMNNTELGSLSSWFPAGNSYPAIAIPSILPDRGEQHYPIVGTAGGQRILGPSAGGMTYGPDGYRGPVLSSSPAVAFSTATPYPYPGFPFGTSFSLPSASFSGASATYIDSSSGGGLCFPAVPSQLLGPTGAVSSHYPRSFMISLPDGTTNGGAESSRKWARHGLDLNAGPGGPDIEGRDERFPSASRQHFVASSQALTEEQVRMYQASGAMLKRKEPD